MSVECVQWLLVRKYFNTMVLTHFLHQRRVIPAIECRWMISVSSALQTLTRRVLALVMMALRLVQVGAGVDIGVDNAGAGFYHRDAALSRTKSISPLEPRGMARSM